MLTAVTSTRIFCTSNCPAQPPRAENIVRMESVRDCLGLGCRPCKRCRPMHREEGPDWLSGLLQLVEDFTAESQSIDEKALRTLGLTKQFLGRWFSAHHQITFDGYCRLRRLGREMGTHYCDSMKLDFRGRKRLFSYLLADERPNETDGSCILVNRLLTPLGPMIVGANEEGICLLEFADRRMLETQFVRISKRIGNQFRTGVNRHIRQLDRELKEYFAGDRLEFDVTLIDDATEFQNAVWQKLMRIPVGTTSTYQQLATELNKPNAVRAVGRANGDNRFSILVPCHRLVGSDGSLTGYGGGLDRKQWLLDHEKKMVAG